jgi:maltose O-acetyltransferase
LTERDKMIAGEPYDPDDPELEEDRLRCREMLRSYTADGERWRLEELIGHLGEGTTVEPPFACDYGYNITLGDRAFVNFNAVFLDCAPITIGARTQIGPGVQLLAADHPADPQARRDGVEFARPIDIGENTWLGGGVIVLPGRNIGANSVVGAGSVVTKDVPEGVVAAGNPCRVIREL